MNLYRALWTALLLPATLWGGALAVCVWVFSGDLLPASIAAVTSLSTTVLIGLLACRSLREALAILRHPDLPGLKDPHSGLWAPLTREARELVQSLESQVQTAVEERNQLEARYQVIRRQLTRMEAAINSLEAPLLICDVRQEVKFANRSARHLLQETEQEASSAAEQTDCDFSHIPELTRLASDTMARHRATPRRTADFALPSSEEGASPRAWRAIATSLTDDSQIQLGLSIVLEDNTREHQDRTRHAEFVSSVCHELKTPLASIQAFTEMLIDQEIETPEEQQEVYGFIDQQADRLSRICTSMLNLARIESGVIEVRREDVELNDILTTALNVVRPAAAEKNITLIPELSGLYLPVCLDRDLFGQAIINLLSNAIKYTPEGGEVRLRSRMADTSAEIEVRDTGMGIPASSLPHIFERFYRVPENTSAANGTGLGLALVHGIVSELHNGRMTVQSQPGSGSCFGVSIPLGHLKISKKKTDSTQVIPGTARQEPART